MNKFRFFLFFSLLIAFSGYSQEAPVKIKVLGTVTNIEPGYGPYSLMVVNKRTGQGTFGDEKGNFSVDIHKNDTLIIGAYGRKTIKISFRDSALKAEYKVKIRLPSLEYQLKEVQVFPQRDLEEIRKDIEKLGYNEKDYMITGVNAFQSPITFLYARYNKHAQKERLAYELMNEDRKRDLLKELFAKYVSHDIIDLKPEQFDLFIDYCNVPEDFMKSSSQYDFIMYIKRKFTQFEKDNDFWGR